MARLLGVDLGDRRIGLALSDPTGFLATAHSILHSIGRARDVAAIAQLAEREQADRVVLGLPLSLNGTEGPQAAKVRRFKDALEGLGLKVDLWDERLTTSQAQRYMRGTDVSRKRQRQTLDANAAAIMLQSYLDARAR